MASMAPVTSPKAVIRMTGVLGAFSPKARSTSKPPARSIRTSDRTRS
jgi:hypothetical protein